MSGPESPPIQLHNTMTRRLEPLRTIAHGQVRMYTCGPTVYDFAHIGNFRAYTWEDCLRRFLKHRGLQVLQVMNITDVDDKIIRDAAAAGLGLDDFTARYIEAFFNDLDHLNVERAEHYPRATRHIPQMIDLCNRLIEGGHTYASEGSVYFRIASFAGYGKLAHLDAAGMKPGARVEADEYTKDDPRDFVLWKARKDGEPFWDTPLGPGRPGWHLECSAMSMEYLGETFDIHTGGVDNIFPHHENEIAQSEAATGKPFVNHWLHCEHLLVDGEKMSKSKGNFYRLVDLLERGMDPRAIRYFLLSAHYRKQLNFTLEGVAQAKSALTRLDDFLERLVREPATRPGDLTQSVATARQRFDAALADDLNTSEALASGFDLLREANAAFDRGEGSAEERRLVGAFFDDLRYVFGIKDPVRDIGLEVEALIARREEARRARDFATADAIRDELLAKGIILEDTPQGVRWKQKS